mgnify:CR=1 FL=1
MLPPQDVAAALEVAGRMTCRSALVISAGIDADQAYLVLEYVDGVTLTDHARQHCPTLAARVRLLLRIAEAVDHAHAQLIVQLKDGRWWDEGERCWRDDAGQPAPWPDIVDFSASTRRKIYLGTAHLDHDPANSRLRNLRALCQRCHLRHDRKEHLRRRRHNRLRRRALGDLFSGPYAIW